VSELVGLIVHASSLADIHSRFIPRSLPHALVSLCMLHMRTSPCSGDGEHTFRPSWHKRTLRPGWRTLTLRPSWLTLRPSWLTLRPSWLTLRPSWLTLRLSWLTLRPSWLTLCPSWRTLTLRPSWLTLCPSWRTLATRNSSLVDATHPSALVHCLSSPAVCLWSENLSVFFSASAPLYVSANASPHEMLDFQFVTQPLVDRHHDVWFSDFKNLSPVPTSRIPVYVQRSRSLWD
jgi:hypothetical protein